MRQDREPWERDLDRVEAAIRNGTAVPARPRPRPRTEKPTMPGPKLKTRQPTGRPSWPLILLAGEAKTGKTYRAAEFTGDERVGRSFFLDLGEGCADEYAEVPGAHYEVIDHDGTWVDIIGQVEAVRDFARAELAAGHKPVCLVIDSMTAEWAMLSAWTDKRARRSKGNRKALAEDPDAEIDITSNYWNDATSRHNQLMNMVKTFPGIVILTTLETEKTQFGADGRPLANAPKQAKPDAQKRLGADVTAWIRLSLTSEPTVVGLRSIRRAVVPGRDKPQPWPNFTIAKFVFEFLGLSSDTAQVRNVPVLDADQPMPGEGPDDPAAAGVQRPPVRAVPSGSDAEKEAVGRRAADALLVATDHAKIDRIDGGIVAQGIGGIDVTGHLPEDDRATLDISEDATVTLDQLSGWVKRYWSRHGFGPRMEGPAPVVEGAPADTAQGQTQPPAPDQKEAS